MAIPGSDAISITNLSLPHPVLAPDVWGNAKAQPAALSLTVQLRGEFQSAASRDALDASTLHYGELAKHIRSACCEGLGVAAVLGTWDAVAATVEAELFRLERVLVQIIEATSFETLESLAEHTIQQLRENLLNERLPGVQVRLRLAKPRAIVFADAPAVEVVRQVPTLAPKGVKLNLIQPYLREASRRRNDAHLRALPEFSHENEIVLQHDRLCLKKPRRPCSATIIRDLAAQLQHGCRHLRTWSQHSSTKRKICPISSERVQWRSLGPRGNAERSDMRCNDKIGTMSPAIEKVGSLYLEVDGRSKDDAKSHACERWQMPFMKNEGIQAGPTHPYKSPPDPRGVLTLASSFIPTNNTQLTHHTMATPKAAIPTHLKPGNGASDGAERHHGKSQSHVAFENTSTSVAASQMRNALNSLADGVTDPKEKQRFETEMDNFFALFRRYLNDKAKGNEIEWSRISPPKPEQVVDYNSLGNSESVEFLNKLAVLKLNGGLGTSMGCVGPKSVIEVRDGMSFLDLSVRQIEFLNRTYDVNVPFVLMNSFNTDADTANIIKKYEGHNIDIMTFNQSRYPRILKDSSLPAPKSANSQISDWYPPGHGDVFESLYNSGILDKLLERGIEILFLSNADNLGAVVDLNILQHMVETRAEYIMELTDKTKADVKGGTIIDYEGQARLLEIAQVPKQYVNEFKSIKKFKYFNTNNIWMNLRAVKRVVENNELSMEIIPNGKSIPADKKGEADVSIVQLETAVGAAIRHFSNAHGVNVPRRRFLPVKTCSDLMLVKSDLYTLKHGQLVMDPNRFGPAPLIKLGNDFKKVSNFQSRIPTIPKILELDHLTITGAVNLGRGVVMKGTVIIVATEGSTIDVPPGSVLENVVVQGSLRLLEH
nr:putative utp--glucose-1-phosphate uridylyltransferase [Quercus suber]